MNKLSIGRIFAEAYGLTFGNLPRLAQVALVPVALMLVLNFAVLFLAGPQPKAWIVIAQNILVVMVQVPLMTSWHRFALLPREVSRPTMGFVYTPRELRFFGYLLLMLVTFSVAMLPAGGLGAAPSPASAFLVLVLLLGFLFVWARLILVFPAASVGDPVRLPDAWRLTQGNGWRIFWLLILISLPFVGVTMVAAIIASGVALAAQDMAMSTVVLSILMIAISVVFAGVYAATLSILYRELAGYDPARFTPA